jgi:hypothetical protein
MEDLLLFLARISKDFYRYGKTGDSKKALKWRKYLENIIRSSSVGSGESN